MDEKIKRHQETVNEMEQALEHIQKAGDLTTCELCIRDLTLTALVLQNLISIIRELIENKNMEKKEKKGFE